MRIDYTEFLGLVYADIFSYPLKRGELRKWAINGGEQKVKQKNIKIKNGLVFFKDREKLVKLRKLREEISKRKLKLIIGTVKKFETIETIEGVFVTGSVAAGNATSESDIDVMIVTTPGKVWITRLKLFRLLKKLKLDRNITNVKDRICTNIFLDLQCLEIREKNLYTAHEVVLAKCLFDRGEIEKKWQQENLWVRGFLPNVFKGVKHQKATARQKIQLPNIIELIAFLGQYLYMLPKITNEKVGLKYAFFHPVDGSKLILARFEKRLRELS